MTFASTSPFTLPPSERGLGIVAALLGALAVPGCSSSCVEEGTLVDTPAGQVPVEAIAVGDLVWSIDPASGERVAGAVSRTASAWRLCRTLRWAGGELSLTPEHPLFDPQRGSYHAADAWIDGRRTRLLAASGESLTVTGVDVVPHPCRVFDLTVGSAHHNFVAAGVLVHNKSPITCHETGCADGEYCVSESCERCDSFGTPCAGDGDCVTGSACVGHPIGCDVCRTLASSCNDACASDGECAVSERCAVDDAGCRGCVAEATACDPACLNREACVDPGAGPRCLNQVDAVDCSGAQVEGAAACGVTPCAAAAERCVLADTTCRVCLGAAE